MFSLFARKGLESAQISAHTYTAVHPSFFILTPRGFPAKDQTFHYNSHLFSKTAKPTSIFGFESPLQIF
jgi:hypothetical protein